MSIVLNEEKFYKEILEGKHNYLTLEAVTKYLTIGCYKKYSKIVDEKYIVDTDAILNEIYPILIGRFGKSKFSKNLSEVVSAVKRSSKENTEFKVSDGVRISKSELDKIRSLNNLLLEKVCFGILVEQKIINLKRGETDRIYKKKLKDYFKKFTNDKMNKANQNKKLNILYKIGMIESPQISEFGKIEQFELLYMDKEVKDTDIEILITDFREIINLYLKYIGKDIGNCEKCNRLIEQKSNRNKFCHQCAREIEADNAVKRKRKQRQKCNVTI